LVGWLVGTVDLLGRHLSQALSGLLILDVSYKCQYRGNSILGQERTYQVTQTHACSTLRSQVIEL
jgi:hypothetical protein